MAADTSSSIGQPVRRKEDYRFLTGSGQFTDDVNPQHHTHAYFLRSPHAHARIQRAHRPRPCNAN
jgi:carbon-monoxide dehydrogenase large subunit